MKNIFCSLLFFLCFSVSAQAQYTLDDSTMIVYKGQPVPEGAVKLGSIKIADNGFKVRCDYNSVMNEAVVRAGKMGGNIVKIKKLVPPAFSSCYKLTADIMKADIGVQLKAAHDKDDSITRSLLPDTANYALLYIYRNAGADGIIELYAKNVFSPSANLLWASINSSFKKIVKINKCGLTDFYATPRGNKITDKKTIKITPGHVYFMRFGLNDAEPGVVSITAATLGFVEPQIGIMEFNDIDDLEK